MILNHLISSKHFLKLLQKPIEMREAEDLEYMMIAISEIEFFQKITSGDTNGIAQRLICKNMEYESFKKDDIVFNAGEVGTKFYLILKGSVRVLINMNKGVKIPPTSLKGLNDLVEIKVYKRGDTFGELALMDDAPRMATIVCREDTCFATLDKANYKKILQKTEMARINKIVSFFRTMSLFSKFSRRSLVSILYPCKLLSFPCNYVLYKEGDDADKLYVILSGKVQVQQEHPYILYFAKKTFSNLFLFSAK